MDIVYGYRGFGECNAFWSIALLRFQHNVYSHMCNLFQNTFKPQGRAIDQNALQNLTTHKAFARKW